MIMQQHLPLCMQLLNLLVASYAQRAQGGEVGGATTPAPALFALSPEVPLLFLKPKFNEGRSMP